MVIPSDAHGVGAALTFGNNFEFKVFVYRGDHTASVRRMIVDDSNTNRFRHLTPPQNQCHAAYGTSASVFRASRQAATALVPLPATAPAPPHCKNAGQSKEEPHRVVLL